MLHHSVLLERVTWFYVASFCSTRKGCMVLCCIILFYKRGLHGSMLHHSALLERVTWFYVASFCADIFPLYPQCKKRLFCFLWFRIK